MDVFLLRGDLVELSFGEVSSSLLVELLSILKKFVELRVRNRLKHVQKQRKSNRMHL